MFSRSAVAAGFIRVLGIDPSTTNMGVCIIDIPLVAGKKLQLRYVNTIQGEQVKYDIPKQFDDTNATSVLARSYGLSRALKEIINLYLPDVTICEDNFLGVSPGTFKQLIQAVSLLREACNSADKPCHLIYVLPNLAKETVGAYFIGSTKEDVKQGVLNYKDLDHNGIDLTDIDEHSSDSVAITLFQCEIIKKDFQEILEAA
jgi:hypothetical protein